MFLNVSKRIIITHFLLLSLKQNFTQSSQQSFSDVGEPLWAETLHMLNLDLTWKQRERDHFLLVTSRKLGELCFHYSSHSPFIMGTTRRRVALKVTAAPSHLQRLLLWPTGPAYGSAILLRVLQERKLNFNLAGYWGICSKFPWQVAF